MKEEDVSHFLLKSISQKPRTTQWCREEASRKLVKAHPAAVEHQLRQLRDSGEIAFGGGMWFVRGEAPLAENKPRRPGKDPHPRQTRWPF